MAWIELESAITATRTARDNSARAAERARVLGIPTLSDQLAQLAASYDRLLANLLYLQNSWPDGPPAAD